jgi:hypothetical protein
MKKLYTTLAFTLLSCFFLSSYAQIDSAAVIQQYYKAHGWGGLYEQVMKADAGKNPLGQRTYTDSTAAATSVDRPVSDPLDIPMTTVQWEETSFHFGKIPDTDSVMHRYYFVNTGSNPLKVNSVKPACGCTAGKYTTEEIQPGAKGFVELKFSPMGKTGIQAKSATVIMNTDPKTHQLTFNAEVIPKNGEAPH